jgi:Domain of unknown function (DUF6431)
MQIICTVPLSPDCYAKENFQRSIKRPISCPRCGNRNALAALGYYSRHVTSAERGVVRIFVRRFRCRICSRTTSLLPSFAQPYRLVLNTTINEFFKGTIGTGSLSWLTLLKQYWNKFANWLPEIDNIMRSVVERSPPQPDATGWWTAIIEVFGSIEKITITLVSRFGVTLFGRYRCHSPQ